MIYSTVFWNCTHAELAKHTYNLCIIYFVKICDVNSIIFEYNNIISHTITLILCLTEMLFLCLVSSQTPGSGDWVHSPLYALLLWALPCQIPQWGPLALVFLCWFTIFSIRLSHVDANAFFLKVEKQLLMYGQHIFIITWSSKVDAYGDYVF